MIYLRPLMGSLHRRTIQALLFGLAISCPMAEAQTLTDPFGYMTFQFVAGKKGAMAIPMANYYKILSPITAAGVDYVEYGVDLPLDLLGTAGNACLDIRTGPGAGESLRVTGFSGRRVNFEGPARVPIDGGIEVGIRPNWTIGELIGSPPPPEIQQGTSAATADVIGLQNPATQTIREFFYMTGAGWREIGHEMEGDRSAIAIPYRSSLQFLRRGGTNIDIVLHGLVPMFYANTHWVRVWPGRNLLTTPFSPATKVSDLFITSSLISGGSAPRSDCFRIVYADATRSPILYHHQQNGWTSIGGGADVAGETPINLTEALDFQHVGPVGYVQFNTAFPQMAAARSAGVVEEVISVDPALSDFPARKLGWVSRPGTSYQVQIQPLGTTLWTDYGTPVVASGEVCQKVCRPEGMGIYRIVVR